MRPLLASPAWDNLGYRAVSLPLVAAALAGFVGCSTRPPAAQTPPPRNYIAEYHELAADARTALQATLRSLDQVSLQTDSCPPTVFDAFSEQVRRLEVDSMKTRAHSQAMQARGDAYFAQWHEHLARIEDPEVRRLAEERRPLLQQSFARIKELSQQAREAFRPFQADLRKLRITLEQDPAAVGAQSTQDLIRTARANGQQVEARLASILDELNAAAALVKPLRAAADH